MNPTLALLQREWMQHRFAWSLWLGLPLVLASLLLIFGDIDIRTVDAGIPAPLIVASVTVAATVALLLVLAAASGLVTALGLARRDHADRSVEFWLSLPISHSRSLLVPMAVHLVLVPLAAVALGLVLGLLFSFIVLARTHGVAAWQALPWSDVITSAFVALARLVAGWPLMVLWLSPLIALAMLSYAWLRRWGLVVLALVLAVGVSPLGELLGYHLVPNTLAAMGKGALGALFSGRHGSELAGPADAVVQYSMQQAPQWLVQDVVGSLQNLASPTFVGGLAFAALCFYGLVQWRKRGASTAL